MATFIKEEFLNDNDYTFLYQCSSDNEFRKIIEQTMLARGYRNIGDDVYEKGNGTLRMLFGAFYKHYKMEIMPQYLGDDQVRVSIKKRSSGFAGGVFGINQIQKELRELYMLFKVL
ncbi:hypothetical protein [Orbus mooreae]|uniref:hypothetical protein n=1 Tax=Orbus mooreae TaxID=3074107 RepID=UPI00370DA178